MNVRVWNVDVIEKRLTHKAVVAVNRIRLDRPVFVKIECDDIRKIQVLFAVQSYEFAIDSNRCRPGWQPKHSLHTGGIILPHETLDDERDVLVHFTSVSEYEGRNFRMANKLCRV